MKALRMGAGAVKAAPGLTGWFDGDQKPARKGVYERDYGSSDMPIVRFCYWNGRYFGHGFSAIDSAQAYVGTSDAQNLPWRGLAADPSKAGV